MAHLTVYYDIHDGIHVPVWMTCRFGRGKIQWHKSYMYLEIAAPFERMLAEDFNDDVISTSVHLEDLTVSPHRPGYLGVDLQSIIRRIKKNENTRHINLEEIEQFVIQMSDVEEVLKLDAVRSFITL